MYIGIRPSVEILWAPSARKVKLESNAQLHCNVSYPGYLRTVQAFWLNTTNRHKVYNKTKKGLGPISTIMLSLHIDNVSRQDVGLYVCEINTSLGTYTAQMQLLLAETAGIERSIWEAFLIYN